MPNAVAMPYQVGNYSDGQSDGLSRLAGLSMLGAVRSSPNWSIRGLGLIPSCSSKMANFGDLPLCLTS